MSYASCGEPLSGSDPVSQRDTVQSIQVEDHNQILLYACYGCKGTGQPIHKELGYEEPRETNYKAFFYSKALLVLSRVLGFFATGAADSMQVVKVLFF